MLCRWGASFGHRWCRNSKRDFQCTEPEGDEVAGHDYHSWGCCRRGARGRGENGHHGKSCPAGCTEEGGVTGKLAQPRYCFIVICYKNEQVKKSCIIHQLWFSVLPVILIHRSRRRPSLRTQFLSSSAWRACWSRNVLLSSKTSWPTWRFNMFTFTVWWNSVKWWNLTIVQTPAAGCDCFATMFPSGDYAGLQKWGKGVLLWRWAAGSWGGICSEDCRERERDGETDGEL